MNEIVKLLDKDLEYIEHLTTEEKMYIQVKSTKKKSKCPICGEESSHRRTYYTKSFQDLPIQGKKVEIILTAKIMYCDNKKCEKKYFAEEFNFIEKNKVRTKRLDEYILDVSKSVSSIAASNTLKNTTINIGKSTICEMLKKKNQNK